MDYQAKLNDLTAQQTGGIGFAAVNRAIGNALGPRTAKAILADIKAKAREILELEDELANALAEAHRSAKAALDAIGNSPRT